MDIRTTYTMKFPSQRKACGLALECHMYKGHLRFFDTIRGHEIPGEIIEDAGDSFRFLSKGFEPGVWEFKKFTIEELHKGTIMIERVDRLDYLQTTDELQDWYWKTFGCESDLQSEEGE